MRLSLGHISCEASASESAVAVASEGEASDVDFRLGLSDTVGACGCEGGDNDVKQRQTICGPHFREVRVQGRSFVHCV